MKYAILETGGKQYKVSEGAKISIERVQGDPGQSIEFTKVLAVNGESGLHVGSPIVESAKVQGEIVANGKNRKIIVFKKKRRKGYTKKHGHRQLYTEVLINKISE